MTVFDDWLSDTAARVDQLPRRSTSALFIAGAGALEPEFRRWAAHTGKDGEPLAERALAAARSYVLTGTPPPDALLTSLEEATPRGESSDEFSNTAAQDYWICVDVSVRVIVDPGYQAGSAIEYALEPLLHKATERLYGVTQLGSGPDEDRQTESLLREPDINQALEFVSWAINVLTEYPTLSESDLAELSSRAQALTP